MSILHFSFGELGYGKISNIIANKVDDGIKKVIMEGLKKRGMEANVAGSVDLMQKFRKQGCLGNQ